MGLRNDNKTFEEFLGVLLKYTQRYLSPWETVEGQDPDTWARYTQKISNRLLWVVEYEQLWPIRAYAGRWIQIQRQKLRRSRARSTVTNQGSDEDDHEQSVPQASKPIRTYFSRAKAEQGGEQPAQGAQSTTRKVPASSSTRYASTATLRTGVSSTSSSSNLSISRGAAAPSAPTPSTAARCRARAPSPAGPETPEVEAGTSTRPVREFLHGLPEPLERKVLPVFLSLGVRDAASLMGLACMDGRNRWLYAMLVGDRVIGLLQWEHIVNGLDKLMERQT